MQEIKHFLTAAECEVLIQMIESNNSRSSVVASGDERASITNHRTSSTSNLDMHHPLMKDIHERIALELNLNIEKGEALQGQVYKPGEYFKPHNDFFTGPAYDMHCKASGNRTHTLMIYLNNVEKGGGTNFPTLNKIVEPEPGMAIWWRNMEDGKLQDKYLHEGVEVDLGKKYIVTSWWREKKWDGIGDERLYNESLKTLKQNVVKKVEVNQDAQETVEELANKSYIIKANQSKSTKTVKKEFSSKDDFPTFSENGFTLIKCPSKTWDLIRESYELLKEKSTVEKFEGKEDIITSGDSEIMSFDHLSSVKSIIHEQLLSTHEDWIKEPLQASYIYGIRSYKKGAVLSSHVDRIATHHISSIIIVDKDLTCGCQNKKYADDWPLDIQGHDGEWYKVYAQPGDMILYESAVCEHGRLENFGGNYFRNFYVHYKLKDWAYVE